jgi:hypothetical protein
VTFSSFITSWYCKITTAIIFSSLIAFKAIFISPTQLIVSATIKSTPASLAQELVLHTFVDIV